MNRLAWIVLVSVVCPIVSVVEADKGKGKGKSTERYVVTRKVEGGALSYRTMSNEEFTNEQKQLEETYKKELKDWKKSKEGARPNKPRLTKLPGTFKTQAEAEKAGRAHADKTGFYTCWNCRGAGTLSRQSGKKTVRYRCPTCYGRKRIKSKGYAVVRVELGEAWTLLLVRRDQVSSIKPNVPAGSANPAGKKAAKAEKVAYKTKVVRPFGAGAFDAATAAYDGLVAKSKGKKGYTAALQYLPSGLKVQWPSQFYSHWKQK